MPKVVRIAEWLNHAFDHQHIAKFNLEALGPGATLVSALRSHKVRLSRDESRFISSLPESQQEALRAALYSAVSRKVPVTFAWAPGYDHELTIWEASGTRGSPGAMTVLLRSPTPASSPQQRRRKR